MLGTGTTKVGSKAGNICEVEQNGESMVVASAVWVRTQWAEWRGHCGGQCCLGQSSAFPPVLENPKQMASPEG